MADYKSNKSNNECNDSPFKESLNQKKYEKETTTPTVIMDYNSLD